MKNLVYMFLIIIASPYKGKGQQSFFIDSLYHYDLSNIEEIEKISQKSEAKKLENDWGLSLGANVTNSLQDQIDAGLSTRLYAKMNFLSSGYYQNLRNKDLIHNQILIDSLQGNKEAIAHNYGIFFDYIIYQYNIEKVVLIDSIIAENTKILDYFQQLYYNKLIDYSELISIIDISNQYSKLKESLESYNYIFSEIIDTILPVPDPNQQWIIDFEGISQSIIADTIDDKILNLENDALDLKEDIENAPSLTLSAGYDISRSRPFFTASFNKKIRTKRKQNLKAKKEKKKNYQRLKGIQKNKEILNIQYEYSYKEKQIIALESKMKETDESLRKLIVRSNIQSLDAGIQEKKITLSKLMLSYEILDLKGQMMLLILKLKNIIPTKIIGPFINRNSINNTARKFAGNRYLLINDITEVSSFDELFLEQNEISLILPSELINLKNIALIDPADSDTRADLEQQILELIIQQGVQNFIIEDIDTFKALEIRTLTQKEIEITYILDK